MVKPYDMSECEIFYRKIGYSKGPYNYLNNEEIEDLVQVAGLLSDRTFSKKDEVWFWHQLIITHFLSMVSTSPFYGKYLQQCSEESLKDFISALQFYYKKYTHIHSKCIDDNTYVKASLKMSDVAKKTLELSNSILSEIHTMIKKSHKKSYTWENFWKDNLGSIDTGPLCEDCIRVFINLNRDFTLPRHGNETELFYSLFTKHEYTNRETYLRSYNYEIGPAFLELLKILIIFSYSYNNNGWIIPRESKSHELNTNVEFIRSVHKYRGGDIDVLASLIEKALPLEPLDCNNLAGSKVIADLQSSQNLNMLASPIKPYFRCLDAREIDSILQIGCVELTEKVMHNLHYNEKMIKQVYKPSPTSGEREDCYLIRESDWNLIKKELYKIIPRDDLKEVEPPKEKLIIAFNLFGYEFSLKAKEETLKPINMADDFPEEIEY